MAALAVVVLASCGHGSSEVTLPQTPVLSGQESHAVVVVPYARLFGEPAITAPVVGHARLADVLEVGTRLPDGLWVRVSSDAAEGWIRSVRVRFYAGEAQAANAARGLLR